MFYRLLRQRLLMVCLSLLLVIGCTKAVKQPLPMQVPLQVLFIGNSYTYVNVLPQMIAALAEAGKHPFTFEMVAQGGWNLAQHAVASLEPINRQKWDWVILQEQSLMPAMLNDSLQGMYPAVRTLHKHITAKGSKTLLYMTWGYRDGFPSMGMPDYTTMQAQVTQGYQALADELNVAIAPVGIAWQTARQQAPQINLWQADGSHPSVEGSYLAACVFYAVFYRQTPVGLAYRANLESAVADQLQKIAADTVLLNQPQWHLPL